MILGVDIETCSAFDIKFGAWAYSLHESTSVCHGDPVVPARRCLWVVDSFHATERGAAKRYAELPSRTGRALVHLDYDRVRLVSPAGVLLDVLL